MRLPQHASMRLPQHARRAARPQLVDGARVRRAISDFDPHRVGHELSRHLHDVRERHVREVDLACEVSRAKERRRLVLETGGGRNDVRVRNLDSLTRTRLATRRVAPVAMRIPLALCHSS